MKPENSTPLWLDIKPEYIDENLDKVILYLQSASHNPEKKDSFYQTTLDLLDIRVNEVLSKRHNTPVFLNEDNRTECIFFTRLLCTYLLVFQDRKTDRYDDAMLAMLACLVLLCQKTDNRDVSQFNHTPTLTLYALDYIQHKTEDRLPFGWSDITSEIHPDILAFRFSKTASNPEQDVTASSFVGKGSISVNKGIRISPLIDKPFGPSVSEVMTVMDDSISIYAPKDIELKKTQCNSLPELERFTHAYIRTQRASRPVSRKVYPEGKEMEVRITSFTGGHINVRTTNPEYETIEGTVVFDKEMFWFREADFIDAFTVGDIIEVTLTDRIRQVFDIHDTFVRFLVDDNAKDSLGDNVLATVINVSPSNIAWQTERGFVAYTPFMSSVEKGDNAIIQLKSCGKDRFYGMVNASYVEETDETFDMDNIRRSFLYSFTIEEDNTSVKETSHKTLRCGIIKELYRLLTETQKCLTLPSERYRILCVSRIMAEAIEDATDSAYLDFISDYLENLVLFSKGKYDDMKPLVAQSDFADIRDVERRVRIIQILMAYGKDRQEGVLADTISTSDDALLVKISQLVQSCNMLDPFIDGAMKNVIKREIVHCLAAETENDTDIEEDNGTYLGIESSTLEFKQSIFEAPKNAKEQNQRINVFKTVCAFLNSDIGGTLYLGVNDLGYVSGLDFDIQHMQRSVIGNYKGIDGYTRYLVDQLKQYFDLSVLTNIDPVPMFNGRAVAIHVKPYNYGIVKLNDIAYVRVGAETLRMTEQLERQMMDRVINNKDNSANLRQIQNAIQNKRQVVLHRYSSSASGKVEDKTVEPFKLVAQNRMVWCYDLSSKENKVFRIDRIGNVQISSDTWTEEPEHKAGNTDIFNMTGITPTPICLRLTLRAKNLLVEEYPESTKFMTEQKDGTWLLETDVYAMEGVGRFYMGLASEMKIITGEPLKTYVRKYVSYYLAFR